MRLALFGPKVQVNVFGRTSLAPNFDCPFQDSLKLRETIRKERKEINSIECLFFYFLALNWTFSSESEEHFHFKNFSVGTGCTVYNAEG